ncbi:VWA domain-containing protein [Xanthomonas sp. NCPPB 2654]|uniref:vWA domain-containing protein n=1 Tax=unclassified Xanthomonas TaxID=2643310 RepID=UPI0021DF7822|nr:MULTISPECIES: VWA domain-containing protein [unclassified Xanthomonas]MDL5366291.1 VWA domain-containing protein [Xanthomonas sp. NCPPB 2654]UYC22289.1 VWA domain-containing protein [Xanthomonas sp. CFBP 8443]
MHPRPHRPTLTCLILATLLAGCSTADERTATPASASADAASATETYASPQLLLEGRASSEPQLVSAPAPPAPPARAIAPAQSYARNAAAKRMPLSAPPPQADREHYQHASDNPVHSAREQPLSTFSIDVDTGSYTNVRRMLHDGQRPPADAVRAEEFINYFDYAHPAPRDTDTPFRVTTELAAAPWNPQRQLLMIGIKGYDVPRQALPPANLVFLIDTSGSMASADKLPLLKQAFAMLVPQLRAQDRVSIVVYAGSAGLVLPPTPGDRHAEILAALERLQAGGSTNGGDGIRLAYATARQGFVAGGSNRVILATDGDFNVGTVDQGALETLVADQRRSGVALSTLGFGRGNYNDAMAERLADVGDGNHAYIDSAREAHKVLVRQMQATLLTIARDVKIQVEFNPAQVAEYRLIGYENRLLAREDFANDKVDAGDIGAGHSVTALYEITPVGSAAPRLPALRYAAPAQPQAPRQAGELAQLRLRYKLPGQERSRLLQSTIATASATTQPSADLRFAAAVAAYADLLRGGTHIDGWGWAQVASAARAATGEDRSGSRREFVELLAIGQGLVAPEAATPVQVSTR